MVKILSQLIKKLENTKLHDLQKENARNIVPKKIGIYAWVDKVTNKIVYIGRAIGKNGLYGRIVTQHLREGYLKKDVKTGKQVQKSAFRISLSKHHPELRIGEFVPFIKNNFELAFAVPENGQKQTVIQAEKLAIKKYNPKYNTKK